jgi:hypothetical protein
MDITGMEEDIQAFVEFTLGNVLATYVMPFPVGGHGSSNWGRDYQMMCSNYMLCMH